MFRRLEMRGIMRGSTVHPQVLDFYLAKAFAGSIRFVYGHDSSLLRILWFGRYFLMLSLD
jgi:hypothetical protein